MAWRHCVGCWGFMGKQKKVEEVDMLADAAAKAGLSEAELASVRAWILGQMAANEHAKLGQAGHVLGEIPLADVFVDLPVAALENRRVYLGQPALPPGSPYFLADFFHGFLILCLMKI